MRWPSIANLLSGIQVPSGYEVDFLSETEIELLISKISSWYPALATGSESCHLDPNFYRREVNLKEAKDDRDICVAIVKFGEEIVALYSLGADWKANWLGGKLTVIAPEHRNANLGYLCMAIFERAGHLVKAGMIWVTGTLQHPYTQKLMEKCNFRLCGIVPACDRDTIDGKPRYVTEALYVKVLAPSNELQEIKPENLTDRTRAFLSFLDGHR